MYIWEVFYYHPSDYQWWITGFNPDYQDHKAEELEVHGSFKFSDEEMWDAFYAKYRNREGWCFDEENKTAYYVW